MSGRILVILAVFVLMLFFAFLTYWKKRGCTETVRARVADITDSSSGYGRRRSYSRRVTYEYEYGGIRYSARSEKAPLFFAPIHEEGTYVDIQLDPSDPQNVFDPMAKWSIINDLIYAAIALAVLIFAFAK
ncbi:MAG: DUF3592 domain-containing protein [Oscillospiraceae bacterium]|nr:DUF3592 domain-containing protein [Oscillospiraceae bacterium]